MKKSLGCGIVIGILMLGVVLPIYGKENSLAVRGNIEVMEEQVENMEKDYEYLENEIIKLLEECD